MPRKKPQIESFNTQPPEGGWINHSVFSDHKAVSTHSRLKAAGDKFFDLFV